MWALSETYVLLHLRSYLEWFGKLLSGGQHTHLGAHHIPSGVTFLTHHHKFFVPFSFHFSIPFMFCLLVLICCSWVSLIIMSMVHHLGGLDHHWYLPCAHFNFANCISYSLYLVFHLCLWKVNLHTYLTTWLSSCPVGIFLMSSPLIAKIQILSKSVTINENI